MSAQRYLSKQMRYDNKPEGIWFKIKISEVWLAPSPFSNELYSGLPSLIKSVDHIKAHMQTQHKHTHRNTAFLSHIVLLCGESLWFLLYSLWARMLYDDRTGTWHKHARAHTYTYSYEKVSGSLFKFYDLLICEKDGFRKETCIQLISNWRILHTKPIRVWLNFFFYKNVHFVVIINPKMHYDWYFYMFRTLATFALSSNCERRLLALLWTN